MRFFELGVVPLCLGLKSVFLQNVKSQRLSLSIWEKSALIPQEAEGLSLLRVSADTELAMTSRKSRNSLLIEMSPSE